MLPGDCFHRQNRLHGSKVARLGSVSEIHTSKASWYLSYYYISLVCFFPVSLFKVPGRSKPLPYQTTWTQGLWRLWGHTLSCTYVPPLVRNNLHTHLVTPHQHHNRIKWVFSIENMGSAWMTHLQKTEQGWKFWVLGYSTDDSALLDRGSWLHT